MGTWISGYLGLEKAQGKDYDYFAFPIIDEGVPHASLGVDSFVIRWPPSPRPLSPPHRSGR